jgi:hypothetical protein
MYASCRAKFLKWITNITYYKTIQQKFEYIISVKYGQIQTDSGVHPSSYPMVTGALSPGVKRQGHEADHSSLSSVEVKKGVAIPTLPHMSL